MKLTGKTAVVTGAASGIGLAIAEAVAEAGAHVILGDIAAEKAESEAHRLRQRNLAADAVTLDVTDDRSISAFTAAALAFDNRVDVVVNAAGWGKVQPFVENTPEFWERVVALNLMGPIKLTRAFLPGMMERRSGKVVNVSSDAGRVGSLGETVYSGAKAGAIGFTKGLAREMARYGVSINCVCPGPTDTPLLAAVPEKFREAFLRAIPMRRFGKPADVAGAVVFFASPRADYITGQVLSVSGGLTMAG
ncbi:MAG: 3-oxoacyl-ACP reductase FabG [Alphaproteobacteria bacterium]|nr:3-oxoacyl-ACP reductase FabG [Alphaproteobacteria bacterium]